MTQPASKRLVTEAAAANKYAGLQTDLGREYLGTKRQIALREWFRSVALRNTAPANLMAIGDSISEGRGASSYATRWTHLLPTLLSTRFPTAGVTRPAATPQYLEAAWSASPQPNDHPVAYVTLSRDVSPPKGLGARSVNISAGGSVTFTVSGGTSVDVFYYKASGTRTIGISLDGGVVTNVDAGNSAIVNDFNSTRVTLPNAGSHTIAVTAVAGVVGLDGIFVYNGDETKGIRCWLGGRSSTQSQMYSSLANPNQNLYFGHQVAKIQPSCVMIELGANDYQQATPVDAATFKTNLQAIISTIRANATRPPSIVLIPVWQWTPGVTPVEPGGWPAFVKAMYDTAATDDDICVMDWQQRLFLGTSTDSATAARGLLSSDFIHPSDAGHWMLANALDRFLSPS